MKKLENIKLLLVNDNDLDCKASKKSLEQLLASDVGLDTKTIHSFDVILYQGDKGHKILRLKK